MWTSGKSFAGPGQKIHRSRRSRQTAALDMAWPRGHSSQHNGLPGLCPEIKSSSQKDAKYRKAQITKETNTVFFLILILLTWATRRYVIPFRKHLPEKTPQLYLWAVWLQIGHFRGSGQILAIIKSFQTAGFQASTLFPVPPNTSMVTLNVCNLLPIIKL